MENQASSKSIMLNYGLVLGITSLFPGLIQYALGQHLEQNYLYSILAFVITITFVVLALKKFKDSNSGLMSWGQGVKIGMGVIVLSLVISLIYLYVFTNFIEPSFKADMVTKAAQQLQETDYSQEIIDNQLKLTDEYFYTFMYGFAAAGGLFFGFVISAITAAIMKRSETYS